jgi:hypothetical protein
MSDQKQPFIFSPCPLCQGEDFTINVEAQREVDNSVDYEWSLKCRGCDHGFVSETLEGLIAGWNRRSERIDCQEESWEPSLTIATCPHCGAKPSLDSTTPPDEEVEVPLASWVDCECGAIGPTRHHVEAARLAWNGLI